MSTLNLLDKNVCRMVIAVLKVDVSRLAIDTSCHERETGSCTIGDGDWFSSKGSNCWVVCPRANPHKALIAAIKSDKNVGLRFSELLYELHATRQPLNKLQELYDRMYPNIPIDQIVHKYLTA